jgi:asparagine synthase (glutamine-hydrolysing)
MGGFLLYNKNSNQIISENALKVFEHKKQRISGEKNFADYKLITFSKRSFENKNFFLFDNEDFIASTGTPVYKKLSGNNAASELYNNFKGTTSLDFRDFQGHFCYIIYFDKKVFIFNDFNGLYHIYRDTNYNIFSNSFLAVTNSLKKKNISHQGLYEYIFYGATYGNDTLINEVKILDNKKIHQLIPQFTSFNKSFPKKVPDKLKFNELIDVISTDLINYFGIITKDYDHFSLGLSGGFDSRLLLSLLLNFNVKPIIYVHGMPDSMDVKISCSIAKAFGLEFESYFDPDNKLIDKDFLKEFIKSKFYSDEGLNDFGIFNSILNKDIEISHRAKINLNGGAGEIFRRITRVPGNSVNVSHFVNEKYNFPRDLVTQKFNKEIFFRNFNNKILDCFDIENIKPLLDTVLVNLADPNFKGRYWGAKITSKLNQYCYSLMPFLEPTFYLKSIYIPNKYKVAGRFEAALIGKINPELAKFNSNYGFNFYKGPNIKDKVAELLKIYSPTYLRGFSKKTAIKQSSELNIIKERGKLIFDNDLLISEYININKILTKFMYSRTLTIEYFLRNCL